MNWLIESPKRQRHWVHRNTPRKHRISFHQKSKSKKSTPVITRINIIWSHSALPHLPLFYSHSRRLFSHSPLSMCVCAIDGASLFLLLWCLFLLQTLAIKCVIRNCAETDLSSCKHFDSHGSNELWTITSTTTAVGLAAAPTVTM